MEALNINWWYASCTNITRIHMEITISHIIWSIVVVIHARLIFSSRRHTALSSINSANVVTFSGAEELLGVILSHSEYEVRETTCITYNWQAVERELVMRYVSNKPILDFNPEQLQFYVFQEDFNLLNQLKSISDSQVLWFSLISMSHYSVWTVHYHVAIIQ